MSQPEEYTGPVLSAPPAQPEYKGPVLSAPPQAQEAEPNRAKQGMGAFIESAASIPDQLLNAPNRIYNLGAEWYNQQEKPKSWANLPQFHDPNIIQGLVSKAGVGSPGVSADDYIGGLVDRVGRFAGASFVPLSRVSSIPELLAQLFGGAVAGTAAAGGGQVAKALGADAGGQQTAEAASTLLLPGAALGAKAGTKSILRGGASPQQIAENTATMRAANIEPTVGQVTGNVAAQGTENLLARVPFAGLPILRRAQQQINAIGSDIAQMSRGLSTVREKPAVGAKIQTDLRTFVEGTSAKFRTLDDDFKGMFSPEQKFALDNTANALRAVTKTSPDLPSFSAGLKDPQLQGWYSRLREDMAGIPAKQVPTGVLGPDGQPVMTTIPGKPFSGVSMQTMIDVRSDIGTQITKSALLGQKPDAQYSALYKAISKDIEAAAKGSPAEAALARRDNYWKSFRGRVDNFLDYIAENPSKTGAYLDTLSGANVGREQILAVRRSVSPETWRTVASAKLAQMGKDTELGEFSLQKFVSEYKKMAEKPKGSNSLSAADALLGGMGTMKKDLDRIAEASEKILAGGRVYQNPSGTSTATVGITAGLLMTASALRRILFEGDLTGPAIDAAAAGGALYGARKLSTVLTNPRTVDWLAKSTEIPASDAMLYMKRLVPIINSTKDPEERKALQEWKDATEERLYRESRHRVPVPQRSETSFTPSAMQGVRG